MLQILGIVAEDSKVVDGIPINRIDRDFLVIHKDGDAGDWSGVNNMAIGKNETVLFGDDESGGRVIASRLGVERPCSGCLYGHDSPNGTRQGVVPGFLV